MENEMDATMPGKRDRKPDGRFEPGDLILNRYKVVAELGQGGMGVVYKCFDEIAGIEVALKALPPELSHNTLEMEDIKENFQLVAKLIHQNIAISKNLEKDNSNGNYYLIMECVEGEDLRRWIKRKRKDETLTLDAIIPVIRQVAEALDYAHHEKVMHRDIKPGNIMISSDGFIKVLDFGLAAQIHTSMTQISMAYHGTSGTGPYMAPEQWRGKRQGAAADQYALAVMTYEMLAGHLPFESTDAAVLREVVLNDVPDEISDISHVVQLAIKRAMSKDPQERFDCCLDFVDELAGKQKKLNRGNKKSLLKLISFILLFLFLLSCSVYFFRDFMDRKNKTEKINTLSNLITTYILQNNWNIAEATIEQLKQIDAEYAADLTKEVRQKKLDYYIRMATAAKKQKEYDRVLAYAAEIRFLNLLSAVEFEDWVKQEKTRIEQERLAEIRKLEEQTASVKNALVNSDYTKAEKLISVIRQKYPGKADSLFKQLTQTKNEQLKNLLRMADNAKKADNLETVRACAKKIRMFDKTAAFELETYVQRREEDIAARKKKEKEIQDIEVQIKQLQLFSKNYNKSMYCLPDQYKSIMQLITSLELRKKYGLDEKNRKILEECDVKKLKIQEMISLCQKFPDDLKALRKKQQDVFNLCIDGNIYPESLASAKEYLQKANDLFQQKKISDAKMFLEKSEQLYAGISEEVQKSIAKKEKVKAKLYGSWRGKMTVTGTTEISNNTITIPSFTMNREIEINEGGSVKIWQENSRDNNSTLCIGSWKYEDNILFITAQDTHGRNVKMTYEIIWIDKDSFEMKQDIYELANIIKNTPGCENINVQCSYDTAGNQLTDMTVTANNTRSVVHTVTSRTIMKRVKK